MATPISTILYDTKKKKEIEDLRFTVAGKIMKKYKYLEQARKSIVPRTRQKLDDYQNILMRKKNRKAHHIFIESQIKNFFNKNSTIDTGKRKIK